MPKSTRGLFGGNRERKTTKNNAWERVLDPAYYDRRDDEEEEKRRTGRFRKECNDNFRRRNGNGDDGEDSCDSSYDGGIKYDPRSKSMNALSEAFQSLDFLDRVHYDTVKLVHEPVHTWSTEKQLKELKKVVEYDELREFKRALKMETSVKNRSGDEKLRDLKYYLDNLGLKRHIHQIRFHEHMIKASLSKIYEMEWETQYEAIMKKFNIVKMKRELLFSCPRRFGKTFSVALYCAAYMLSIPNCQVAVFSTGKRTAKKLMMLILSFLARFNGFEDYVDIKNQEDLVLEFGSFDKRQLSCYPSTVKVRRRHFFLFSFFFAGSGDYNEVCLQSMYF
jgi:hypothetical protein